MIHDHLDALCAHAATTSRAHGLFDLAVYYEECRYLMSKFDPVKTERSFYRWRLGVHAVSTPKLTLPRGTYAECSQQLASGVQIVSDEFLAQRWSNP